MNVFRYDKLSNENDSLINKAKEINRRVKKELGFTVNIGVAHNKLLAKNGLRLYKA